jgi:hypothetical protein
MKLLRTTLLTLLTAVLTTSCWKTDEDLSLCGVDNNLILTFSIRDVPNAEFGDHIEQFDVFLFDSEHLFIETRRVSAPSSDGIYKAIFTVEPGTYYAICWGNTGQRSLLPSLDHHNNPENSYIEAGSDESSDPIYYAPHKVPTFLLQRTRGASEEYSRYEIVVPPQTQVTRELLFAKAHRQVEVFISGYETSRHYDGAVPFVERSGARRKYDFLLRANPLQHTVRLPSVPSGRSDATLRTSFNSCLTPIMGDGWVRLYHPTTDAVIAEVKIADYIAEHHIEDDSYIPVQFIFDMDVNVRVTLPSWINNDLTPGIHK